MRVLITGFSGQIGSFLLPTLLKSGFEIATFGRSKTDSLTRTKTSHHFQTEQYDFLDIKTAIESFRPNSIVNLASLSSVAACEKNPKLSKKINSCFPLEILDFLESMSSLDCHFIQASSSEMFAGFREIIINEETTINPVSIYGKHKSEVHLKIQSIQESRKLRASSVILFNNESFRRPDSFATKKIVKGLVAVKLKQIDELRIGNSFVSRDWNHPCDTSEALRLIIEGATSTNYVVGSGEVHSIKDFVSMSATLLGLSEDSFNLISDPAFQRQNENHGLYADSSKIRAELGWKPSLSFAEIVQEIVQSELENATEEER